MARQADCKSAATALSVRIRPVAFGVLFMARGRKATVSIVAGDVADSREVTEPPGLSPMASAKWRHLVPLLVQSRGLVQTDADAIAQYCEAYALRQRALVELQADGAKLVHETPNGALQINPLITIARQQEAVMMRLSERFGLDPARRQRLKIADGSAKGDDDFGAFLKEGEGAGGDP